jgi:hypothetical protein
MLVVSRIRGAYPRFRVPPYLVAASWRTLDGGRWHERLPDLTAVLIRRLARAWCTRQWRLSEEEAAGSSLLGASSSKLEHTDQATRGAALLLLVSVSKQQRKTNSIR